MGDPQAAPDLVPDLAPGGAPDLEPEAPAVGIVDAQVHLWSRVIADPHLPQEPSFDTDRVLPLMAEAGVGRAVLVPATWDADWNASCLRAASAHPDRFAVFGRIAVEDPASRNLLPTWKDQPGMLGIRISFRRDPWATWLTDGTADWLWPAAEQAGIPLMLYLPGRVREVAEIARRHPGLRLIVDHLGILPSADAGERARQLADVLSVASWDNVAVKISALPLYSHQEYPFGDIHPMVREIVHTFGAGRSFWGSDVSRLDCSYPQAVSMMDEVLDGFTARQRDLVMGAAITDWLGWTTP